MGPHAHLTSARCAVSNRGALQVPSGAIKLAELIFHREGHRIVDFRKEWATACRKAGLAATDPATGKLRTDRTFHDFRRKPDARGVPDRVAMQVSGHKTRSVFDRYNIVSEPDIRDAQAKVGQHYHARQNP